MRMPNIALLVPTIAVVVFCWRGAGNGRRFGTRRG